MPKPIKSSTNKSSTIAKQCNPPMIPTLKKVQMLILKPTPTMPGKPVVPENMPNYLSALTNKVEAI
jgi:hypothetical protein